MFAILQNLLSEFEKRFGQVNPETGLDEILLEVAVCTKEVCAHRLVSLFSVKSLHQKDDKKYNSTAIKRRYMRVIHSNQKNRDSISISGCVCVILSVCMCVCVCEHVCLCVCMSVFF